MLLFGRARISKKKFVVFQTPAGPPSVGALPKNNEDTFHEVRVEDEAYVDGGPLLGGRRVLIRRGLALGSRTITTMLSTMTSMQAVLNLRDKGGHFPSV